MTNFYSRINNIWQGVFQFFQGHLARISLVKFFSEFILIIFFTVLPTIVVIVWIYMTKGTMVDDYDLYKGGEFLLYAVSFLSSALVAMTNRQFSNGDWREIIKRLLIIPIMLISTCYTSVFVMKENIDKEVLSQFSYIGMLFSFGLFFFAQFWNSQQTIDVGDERRNEQHNIVENLS
jgi:cytochrome bd-type quinol oxidase subunit 2